ncbi:SGNH/GDSL hydrolase family protein [Prauserella flavalba]|uniref:SGNH/GDSL hydrolase family protein n=1 Tax=Prauserella flavalba TaxID=1477506 RepID=UPI0036E9B59A
MRKALATALLAAVAGACTPGADAVDGTAPHAGHYVALGDSYVSGPGTGTPTGVPSGCLRSDHNYPHLIAAELGVEKLSDVSCGGARTENLTAPQPTPQGTNPPQLDALRPDTALVTLGIGGNDVNLIERAAECARGAACLDMNAAGVPEWLASVLAEVGSRLGSALDEIAERAPSARVIVVGYPTILPTDAGECALEYPESVDRIPSLRQGLDALNAMLAEQAAKHGAEYADTVTPTRGHGVCAPPESRWVEGLEPVTGAHPLHPTARGERALADAVLGVIL